MFDIAVILLTLAALGLGRCAYHMAEIAREVWRWPLLYHGKRDGAAYYLISLIMWGSMAATLVMLMSVSLTAVVAGILSGLVMNLAYKVFF